MDKQILTSSPDREWKTEMDITVWKMDITVDIKWILLILMNPLFI